MRLVHSSGTVHLLAEFEDEIAAKDAGLSAGESVTYPGYHYVLSLRLGSGSAESRAALTGLRAALARFGGETYDGE
ncbi:hypothetical protein F4561_001496 [Lipingzhangella halophila]|uniref:Uncharacterized protein n=1 Tax=Lipingzhangella halophila TaxID=1783352 RepID=A0A7W7W1I6_9ACTN|nr:hypothetical protein [Lipingzhangella halophila]MBB4930676.1 hypothetical protein [Lipingzhangella halophila]